MFDGVRTVVILTVAAWVTRAAAAASDECDCATLRESFQAMQKEFAELRLAHLEMRSLMRDTLIPAIAVNPQGAVQPLSDASPRRLEAAVGDESATIRLHGAGALQSFLRGHLDSELAF